MFFSVMLFLGTLVRERFSIEYISSGLGIGVWIGLSNFWLLLFLPMTQPVVADTTALVIRSVTAIVFLTERVFGR